MQHNLGLIYKQWVIGAQQENLNELIACFKRTLEVYAPEVFPQDRAMNQYNLGNVLMMAHFARADKKKSSTAQRSHCLL